MTNTLCLLYTTFPDQESARDLCTQLLESKLIACANILSPMTSLYMWSDQDGIASTLQQETETPVLLKSTSTNFKKIESYLTEHHPYDTPCLIQIDTANVGKKYIAWVEGCVEK